MKGLSGLMSQLGAAVTTEKKMDLNAWLEERAANCRRIADGKQGEDRAGWLEDAAYFDAAREAAEGAARWKRAAEANIGENVELRQLLQNMEAARDFALKENMRLRNENFALRQLAKPETRRVVAESMQKLGARLAELLTNDLAPMPWVLDQCNDKGVCVKDSRGEDLYFEDFGGISDEMSSGQREHIIERARLFAQWLVAFSNDRAGA